MTMILGALLFVATAATDLSGWHTYSPPGSDIRFSMPGTVYGDSRPDETGGAKQLYKYHSTYHGITYTIVYGDLADKLAPAMLRLLKQYPTGAAVKEILENTLKASAAASQGMVTFDRFGNLKGFPTVAQLLRHPDGTGTNQMAILTKRGIVVAGVRSPRTPDAASDGVRFADSVDLSARK